MAYTTKYKIEYKDVNDITTTIYIKQDGYVGDIIELQPDVNPLLIQLPTNSDVYTPIASGGATINVVTNDAVNNRDLFAIDPKELQVLISKAGGYSWVGYVATEIYNENYSKTNNYELVINANDGLSILNRYEYLNNGAAFTGNESVLVIINRIINQIGIGIDALNVSTKLNFDNNNSSRLLEGLYIQNSNFYDESNNALTYYDVLENICISLGITAFIYKNEFYLVDNIDLFDESLDFDTYDVSDGVYSSSYNTTSNNDLSGATLNFYSNNSQLDIKAGYSKQAINYSGYGFDDLLDYTDWQSLGNHDTTPISYSLVDTGEIEYYSSTNWISGVTGYNTFYVNGWYVAYKSDDPTNKEYSAKLSIDKTNSAWGEGRELLYNNTSNIKHIQHVDGYSIKLTFDIRFGSIDNPFYYFDTANDVSLYWLKTNLKLKVDNQYYDSSNDVWSASSSSYVGVMVYRENVGDVINDIWHTKEIEIPLTGGIGGDCGNGDVTVIFTDKMSSSTHDDASNTNTIDRIHIKNVSANIIKNSTGEINNEDLQIIGDVSELNFQNQAPAIGLILGDSSEQHPTHKGGFLNSNGDFATDFYKDIANKQPLFNILLQSHTTQFSDVRYILSAELTNNTNLYFGGVLSKIKTISDNTYLANKKFMLLSGEYNDKYNFINGQFMELKNNEDIIIG